MASPLLLESATDVDLVRAAQRGEVEQLGLLLARHRASMQAVAVAIHGHRPAAEDAVQEACLLALRRIDQVRDPAAIGAWLRMLVRNVCRMQLRRQTAIPVSDPDVLRQYDVEPDPARIIEDHAGRDWLWTAIGQLTPTLQLPVLLRYFTEVTSYEAIAKLCDIPVGTVRSRLNKARSKLAEGLVATATEAHDDICRLTAQRRQEALEVLQAPYSGEMRAALASFMSPSVETFWPTGLHTTGYDYMVRAMDRDLTAGVRHELGDVVAGHSHIIWEDRLVNPPDDPDHCPPSVLWILQLDGDRVGSLRLHHQPRSNPSGDAATESVVQAIKPDSVDLGDGLEGLAS